MRKFALICWVLAGAIIVGCSRSEYPKQKRASLAAKKQSILAHEILNSALTQDQMSDPYEIKSEYKFVNSKGNQTREKRFPQYIARKNVKNFRIKMPSPGVQFLIVSNDRSKWLYQMNKHEYVKKSSKSGSNKNIQNIVGMMQKVQKSYASVFQGNADSLTAHIDRVSFAGVDTLKLADHSEHVADKIKVTYRIKKNSKLGKYSVSPTTYWVDKKNHLILRREMNMSNQISGSKSTEVTLTLSYSVKHVDFAPTFADSVFTFQPPKEAKKVKKLSFRNQPTQKSSNNLVGKSAPDFQLATFDGKKVSLKDYRGHVVVLDFWATWCGPCRKSHPKLQKIYEKNKDKGLVVLGVNNESKKKVKSYMRNYDYTFTNLDDARSRVQQMYGVHAIPTEYIINPKGQIVDYLRGYHPQRNELRQALKKAGLSL